MFTALKRSVLFSMTAAGVVPCGGRKQSPRTSFIVQFIFSFWSFEVSDGILRNRKIILGIDSFTKQRSIYIWPHLDYICLRIDYPVERCTITLDLLGSMLPNLIGSFKRLWWPKPRYEPPLFLINMLTALKGSQFYFIIMFSRVYNHVADVNARNKCLPTQTS